VKGALKDMKVEMQPACTLGGSLICDRMLLTISDTAVEEGESQSAPPPTSSEDAVSSANLDGGR
jgi:hypothetical protein